MLKNLLFGLMVLISPSVFAQQPQINRNEFYAAMESKKLDLVNNQQLIAKKAGNSGFEGALLMKKAGLVSGFSEKYSLFQTGHKMLDEAIKQDQENAELRFLRLMVQEHAPRLLNYRGNIEDDSNILRKSFNQLLPETRNAVLRYTKESKILKPGDFKE